MAAIVAAAAFTLFPHATAAERVHLSSPGFGRIGTSQNEVISVEDSEHASRPLVFLLAPFSAQARRLTQHRLVFQGSSE